MYKQRKIDGIITLDPTGYQDQEWAEQIHEAGAPYVSVEGYAEFPGIVSVLADYGTSITTALDYICRDRRTAPYYIQAYQEDSLNNCVITSYSIHYTKLYES